MAQGDLMQDSGGRPPAVIPDGAALSTSAGDPSGGRPAAWNRLSSWFTVARSGLIGALLVIVAVFWALRPDVFSQWSTWRGVLEASAIPAVVAMALTVVLIVGDFDLSIGATLGMSMAIAISLMAQHSVSWPLAVLVALVAAAAVGLVNGALVTRARVNSFIGTLATSSIVGGIDARVSNQRTITQGVPAGFADLGSAHWLGVSVALWVAIVVAVVLYLFVAQSETGRYLYAVGGNREAARLAGVRVRGLRTLGFVSAAVGAGLGGVLLAAQSASYYPNAGGGYLLPAYAAAFLGTAAGGGRFGILATAFGVFFLQTLQTGLTVINVQPWVVLVVQGVVLAVAVMASVAGKDRSLRIRLPRRRAVPA